MKWLIVASFLAGCASDAPSSIRIPAKVKRSVPEPVREALLRGESLELLSLYPYPKGYDQKLWRERGYDKLARVDDYAVLGTMALDKNQRAKALRAFFDGIQRSDGTVAACFNPRHALRTRHGGAVYDVVICYECLSMIFFRDGKHLGSTTTVKAPGKKLTALLESAGVTRTDQLR